MKFKNFILFGFVFIFMFSFVSAKTVLINQTFEGADKTSWYNYVNPYTTTLSAKSLLNQTYSFANYDNIAGTGDEYYRNISSGTSKQINISFSIYWIYLVLEVLV